MTRLMLEKLARSQNDDEADREKVGRQNISFRLLNIFLSVVTHMIFIL